MAIRVTRDALDVETPRRIVGDSEFDMLDWHNHLLVQSTVPVAAYNPRNTVDPLDIDYCVEQRIKEQSEAVRLWRQQLEETYSCRSQVEAAIEVYKNLGLGPHRFEAEVESKHMYSSSCVFDWLLHSLITIEEMISQAQLSRYKTNSAPPPNLVIFR